MKIIAMVPARLESTRLPKKLLMDLCGKTVIQRTFEATMQTNLFNEVYIVTDSAEIYAHIKGFGGKVIMSRKNHDCGSDRIAEAVADMDVDVVVNVQGDEPFIDTDSLSLLVDLFKNDTLQQIDVGSLQIKLTDRKAIENPNNVKVITDSNNNALYFSRSVIPYNRDKSDNVNYFKHKGVYAFRKSALTDFYNTPITPLEAAEKIEAIRYLEMGKTIKMLTTKTEGIGIDTAQDLKDAILYLKNQQ